MFLHPDFLMDMATAAGIMPFSLDPQLVIKRLVHMLLILSPEEFHLNVMKNFLHTKATTVDIPDMELAEALMEDLIYYFKTRMHKETKDRFIVACNFDLLVPDNQLKTEKWKKLVPVFLSTHMMKVIGSLGLPCSVHWGKDTEEMPMAKSFYLFHRSHMEYLMAMFDNRPTWFEYLLSLFEPTKLWKKPATYMALYAIEIIHQRGKLNDENLLQLVPLISVLNDRFYTHYTKKMPVTVLLANLRRNRFRAENGWGFYRILLLLHRFIDHPGYIAFREQYQKEFKIMYMAVMMYIMSEQHYAQKQFLKYVIWENVAAFPQKWKDLYDAVRLWLNLTQHFVPEISFADSPRSHWYNEHTKAKEYRPSECLLLTDENDEKEITSDVREPIKEFLRENQFFIY